MGTKLGFGVMGSFFLKKEKRISNGCAKGSLEFIDRKLSVTLVR